MNSAARSPRPAALCGVALVWLALSTPGSGAGESYVPTEPDTGAGGEDKSFLALPTTRDHIGRVVIPVKINGQGPFRFIVDTGAEHSTISPALVQALGLHPSPESQIVLDGITGTAQVSFVTVQQLQAGDLTIDGLALPVVSTPVMAGADGILGAAGLTEKNLLIDFQRNWVAISRSLGSDRREALTKIHATRLTHGLIAVDTRVGGVRVHAVVDTGAERTLGNLALRQALKAHRDAGHTAYVTSVYGATEEIEPGEIQAAPPIVIDTLRINDVSIVFGSFHIFKVWGMEDEPAMIIGMDVLGTVASLCIDFKNEAVYVGSRPASQDLHATLHEYSNNNSRK